MDFNVWERIQKDIKLNEITQKMTWEQPILNLELLFYQEMILQKQFQD